MKGNERKHNDIDERQNDYNHVEINLRGSSQIGFGWKIRQFDSSPCLDVITQTTWNQCAPVFTVEDSSNRVIVVESEMHNLFTDCATVGTAFSNRPDVQVTISWRCDDQLVVCSSETAGAIVCPIVIILYGRC